MTNVSVISDVLVHTSNRRLPQTDSALPTALARVERRRSPLTPRKSVARGEVSPELIRDEILCELFVARVDATPDAIAMETRDQSLTYREVDQRSNAIARGLLADGIGPRDFVGLWMERGPDLLIGQIAIAKTGAAWLPFDADAPIDRVATCLEDSKAKAILTSRTYASKLATLEGPKVLVDETVRMASDGRLPSPRERGAKPEDPAYMIYTSGSTGRPKSVVITARNICHYLRSANRIFGIKASDKVLQSASVAFDLSMEEIWIPYLVGATLFVATSEFMADTEQFPRRLEEAGVTVIDTVPTLLNILPQDIRTVNTIILGGEACPLATVKRWARKGRKIFNSYGPTETTVVATIAELRPNEDVTIGRPIPNYTCYVVDGDLNLVEAGEEGELLIGGVGVGLGYWRRQELTRQKFIRNPFGDREAFPRLYRSGDAVSMDVHGNLRFHGRIDDQVKIRGFRIELGEIETLLTEDRDVQASAVVVRQDTGIDELVAFIVPKRGSAPDGRKLNAGLREKLPSYMIPSRLEFVDTLPTLPSGKVDRKKLKAVSLTAAKPQAEPQEAPRIETEALLLAGAREVLSQPTIPFDADFFNDLGGHSLLAARFVSVLRRTPRLASVTLQDLYERRSLRALGVHLDQSHAAASEPGKTIVSTSPRPEPIQPKPSIAASTFQALVTLLLAPLLFAPLTLIVLPRLDDLVRGHSTLLQFTLPLLPALVGYPLFLLVVGVASKWLIIGRYRAGAYPLWSGYYLRWWLAGRLQAMTGLGLWAGTPLMPFFYRLMGAKVGRNCAINTSLCSSFDLVTIGDDTSIDSDTQLLGYRIENGHLLLGSVEIGSRCFVGSRCALGLDVKMEDDSRLEAQSLLSDGSTIGKGELWRGSPARPAKLEAFAASELLRPSLLRQAVFMLGLVTLGGGASLASAAVSFGLMSLFLEAYLSGWLMVLSAVAPPLLFVLTCLWIVMLKSAFLRKATPGSRQLYSFYYLRYWMASGLMRLSRFLLLPIFGTLYLPPLLRLLGAKIGANTEIASVWSFGLPELLTSGEGCFFADGSILGGRKTFGGRFELQAVSVGSRSFIGNSAMLPGGSRVGDDCLLGVMSVPPTRMQSTPNGSEWLGSPSFQLPPRVKVAGFADTTTFRPTASKYIQRALIDACRILIPSYSATLLGLAGIAAILWVYEAEGLLSAIVFGPVLEIGLMAATVAIVVALKWAVMGRYKPIIAPLWSRYVWLNEMLTGVYESMMAPVVGMFFGTPYAAPLLRLLGCKIGRFSYIETSFFSEFDLVDIGDHVALNLGSTIQNHLFEDRIMKASGLRIDDEASVGNMAVVLYDSHMEKRAILGPLSLLMKGETLPAATRRHGVPTVQA